MRYVIDGVALTVVNSPARQEATVTTTQVPLLKPVKLVDLRPTQITVGMREVREKQKQWRGHVEKDGPEFLGRHMIPVVLGPRGRNYVIDHHHLGRALLDEGVEQVLVNVLADLSDLAKAAFWIYLDNRAWCHPYNDDGERVTFDDIPKSLGDMPDDPFRSLAGELRRAGGYAKSEAPFSEFTWADFLRRRIKRRAVDKDFSAALTEALTLAKGEDARYLPGWCGPHTD
jgi:hypothetical protein